MKLELILSAALAAGMLSTSAATSTTNAVVGTNANPKDAMTALFGDPAIVKGKGFEIKRSELDQVLSSAKANATAQGRMMPADFDISVLNQLITIQVLLQKATDADRVLGKVEADAQYAKLLKQFGSVEAFDHQLKAVGMTAEDLRAKATQEAVAKATLKRELGINITDDEAKAYYNNHAADFEQPEMAHVRHILLMTIDPATHSPLMTNTIAAKRKQIEDLRSKVLAGGDFAALAKEFSEDPGSKENGGELPEFPRGQMVPEFESAAFALTNNQVSDVITTTYGFHIIKSMGKKAAQKIAYTEVATDIQEGLGRQKIAKLAPDYVTKLRAEYAVEIQDPNLKALDEKVKAAQAEAAKEAAVLPATPENAK
jgi:parvulin-like peptidyl-prolyl isomerase